MNSKKKRISLWLIGLILLSPYVGMAQIPELPLVIEGEVSIGGSPAPNGTVVSAFMDGAERTRYIVTNPGKYALAVSGSNAADKNKTVKLFVNGIDTSSTIVWKSGAEPVTINLFIAAQPSAATTSSDAAIRKPAADAASGGSGAAQTQAPAATSSESSVTMTPPLAATPVSSDVTQTPAPSATSGESNAAQTPVNSTDGPTAVMSLFIIIVILWIRGQKR